MTVTVEALCERARPGETGESVSWDLNELVTQIGDVPEQLPLLK